MNTAIARLNVAIRQLSDYSDGLYAMVVKAVSIARPRWMELLATQETEIVIEGFPRSANTFFYYFFVTAQSRDVRIAHHLHSSFQVHTAVKHGIPCIFLVRDPLEAIASAVMRREELDPKQECRSYLSLHESIMPHAAKIIVASTSIAVEHPNHVIDCTNAKYGSSFELLPLSRMEEVSRAVEQAHLETWNLEEPDPIKLALPSAEKTRRKQEVYSRVRSACGPLLERCNAVYLELLEHSIDARKTERAMNAHPEVARRGKGMLRASGFRPKCALVPVGRPDWVQA